MNNNSWQPIETAPRDNIIVLTNVGFARFVKNSVAEDPFWYLCDINGVRKFERCQTYIVVFPEFWMPVPPIPVDKR